ncbi:signal recognition particle-docking protein FtsY [Ligilactobacillus ruminis]|uniref:signal recognition particle-docking protein FtsY n=1 Tax=Ligilactobacillus ruminis TaxID=1623 RepID=UPI003F9BCCA5|nr:signal recognition particle-docking protein FtsY [Ligilactobacillus ruminis]
MGFFDKLKKAFSFEPENEENEAEKVADKAETEMSDANYADSDEETSKSELVEKKAQPEPEQAGEKTHETDGENDSEQSASKDVLEEKTEEERYDKGLAKSRKGFGAKINALLANFRHVDEDFFDDLEETLIEADVGYETAMNISDELRDEVKLRNAKKKSDVSDAIIERLVNLYEESGKGEDNALHFAKQGPTVFLFVGVNGVGKTTTIGKLAHRYKEEGKKVLLAAGDTFRAGAIEQLAEWGRRVGVDVVKKPEQSDPAAVVYDAVVKAKQENYDILLVDTAGRLQNKVNLMKELDKIKRVITREVPDAPHEVLLALDATTGQNALTQAKQFKEVTDVTGIVLTKLDGTARGGIVLAIRNELKLPVKLVGLGEQMDDLRDFDPQEFVIGLFKGLVAKDR